MKLSWPCANHTLSRVTSIPLSQTCTVLSTRVLRSFTATDCGRVRSAFA